METLNPAPPQKREPLVKPPDSGVIKAKGKPRTLHESADPTTRYTQAFFNDDGTPKEDGPPLEIVMEGMTFG